MPLEELERLLAELGFARLRWEDKTGVSADFFRAALKHVKTNGWRPAAMHLVMGDDTTAKFNNVLRNLEEGRLRVVQAVMKRVP